MLLLSFALLVGSVGASAEVIYGPVRGHHIHFTVFDASREVWSGTVAAEHLPELARAVAAAGGTLLVTDVESPASVTSGGGGYGLHNGLDIAPPPPPGPPPAD